MTLFEGLKKRAEQKRELKELEDKAYHQEQIRMAPHSGVLKARAEEKRIREGRENKGKGGGVFGSIMDFGGNVSKNSEKFYAPPSGGADFMSPVMGTGKRKGKKHSDPFADFY